MSEVKHMSRAGKTFYFASLWLDRNIRRDVAVAYSFCRTVDDLADEQPIGLRRTRALAEMRDALLREELGNPLTEGLLGLIRRFPDIKAPAVALVEACAADGPGLVIESQHDLLRYAHGVAGNVGLMMYPILGGTDPRGLQSADELGMAMQCTNIARDVVADLQSGRLYLPSEWLIRDDIRGLLRGDEAIEQSVVVAVRRVLALGAELYTTGLDGLSWLPAQSRFAIRVAAECYAAIGSRIVRNGKLARTRAVVPLVEKVGLALKAARGRGLARVHT